MKYVGDFIHNYFPAIIGILVLVLLVIAILNRRALFGDRVCPCCHLRFHFKTDEAMFGQMTCWGCASAVKKLRASGDERFATHEYPPEQKEKL